MKVKLEIDPDQSENEVIIKAAKITPEIERLYRRLQENSAQDDQITGYRGSTAYYLKISDILFFETEAKQVMAHTKKHSYAVKYKLYELENLLGGQFMRVSKSTILNLDQIYALTRSISNCQIQFQNSYKTVYVSRRYYRELRTKLDERRAQ
ncbi:LytTR family DNA-binding domain-containing protein [Lactobacillus corticis]|uniref:LytR family transcriptional regulator n=1 Tax=Lactobacillus corticis TaxID=2201249 RepID=A0A916QH74_9LACO|nr:LytTR family DNA-binding domain-containing protein [Lactobacillus corticis]GFZ27311.1 LytR family transcriptional regulator [Lactobacillus corticis]